MLASLFTLLFMLILLLDIFTSVSPFIGPLLLCYGIYLVIKNQKKKSDRNKIVQQEKKINSNDAKLLKSLSDYFETDARLYFDDETYITPADPNNITFDTLEVYMRDEYIATLADYKVAFPNAYNNFITMIDSYLKAKNASKRSTRKSKTVTPVAQTTNTVTNEPKQTKAPVKDAEYYIDKLTELNNNISEENITNGLYETVLYLSQIKKIEDTFPKCREKTTKLYQYYLPMLTDILENYNRLSINADLHKEFKENEDRLMKTIVLINGALKALTESLCDEYYLEMATDMKTLETLLKKDGLAPDGLTFENIQKEKEVTANGE